MPEKHDITRLLHAFRDGDRAAFDRLFELVYADLHRRAHFQLRESGGSSLATTGLVHEGYIKLVAAGDPDWECRRHFYRVAARATRQIVIDRARRHQLTGKDTPEYYPAAPAHPLLRSRVGREARVSHQRLHGACARNRSALSEPLADRALLQMDQAASPDQGLLRDLRQRRKTQVWIAIATYVLVAIVRKRLEIERDLYTMLQILSVYVFEKAPLAQLLSAQAYTRENRTFSNQLSFFEL